jgi:DNA invertase Pin-like site-specific DNA recombinase
MNQSDSPFTGGSAVVVYLRHSPGDQQTIESQESAVRAWCAERHLAILRVYRDEARSGTTTAGREDFLAMVDALRDGVIVPRPAGVVLWSFSRFARDYDDAQYYTALLRRNDYEIKSMTDAIPEGEIGRVVESLHHWMNAEAARRIGQDAKRGLLWLAEQGYWHGARPPRGYILGEPARVGARKNGVERIAHKLIFDPDWEARVRAAWQAKLQGALNWQIHNEFKIYPAINSYTTFFDNITYAGFIKCGERKYPNAHPAYVTLAEFERVQHTRRVMPHNAKAPDGDPGHSRRQQSPFLLSGLFYCGLCGYVMSGQRYGDEMFYKCGRRHRHGPSACGNKSIVAWYVHDLVLDWLCANVFTRDYLFANREQINARIGGDRSVLESRRKQIADELERIDRQVQNLVDSIARLGLTAPIERAIQDRQADARTREHDLAEVDARLSQQRIELGDDALEYIAAHLRDELLGDVLEDVRRVLRQVLVRVEIAEKDMTLYYVSPLVERPKSVIAQLPPWGAFLIDAPGVQIGRFTYARPPTGRASHVYAAGL